MTFLNRCLLISNQRLIVHLAASTLCYLIAVTAFGQSLNRATTQERTIQDLINACRAYPVTTLQNTNLKVCRFITDLEQIGANVIEIIKTLMPLGPFEYFVFTWVNFQTTGRLRAQLQPLFHPKLRNVVEYRKEGEVWILVSWEW